MNEREDYLDRLLRGVEDDPEEFQGSEEDFLEEFNSSFSEDDENDFLQEFERSKNKADSESDLDMDFDMEDIDNIVSNVKNGTLDDMDQIDTLDEMDALDEIDTIGDIDTFGEIDNLGEEDLSIDETLQNFPEEDPVLDQIEPEFEAQESEFESENQEFMVNTMGDADMLGFGEEDAEQGMEDMFSDMGEEGEADNMPEDELESIARDLAKEIGDLGIGSNDESESEKDNKKELEQVLLEEEPEKGKKGKKKKEDPDGKKPGLLKRISLALFGEDEEEESGGVPQNADIDNLSDENMEILRELDGKKGKKEKDEKALKAQKKKEKKAQKDQKKAEKKQAKAEKKAQKEKEKQAKPKKEKKPKVVEKSKPLPKKPVFMIMLVGASLVVLIYLVTTQVGYSLDIANAKEYYENGDYVEAYTCFTQGAKVKAVDEELYNKAKYTAYVQQQLRSYYTYQEQELYTESLNALICGVGRYDKNASDAAKAGAAAEYDNMLAELEKLLSEKFGMTLDQARELYAVHDKEDYTYMLYDIINSLGLLK